MRVILIFLYNPQQESHGENLPKSRAIPSNVILFFFYNVSAKKQVENTTLTYYDLLTFFFYTHLSVTQQHYNSFEVIVLAARWMNALFWSPTPEKKSIWLVSCHVSVYSGFSELAHWKQLHVVAEKDTSTAVRMDQNNEVTHQTS